MAGLFGGPDAPQYVGPSGNALATQPARAEGLFGMFPSTPDYTAPATPGGSTPAPGGGTPAPVPPGIELSVKVPGLLNVQGSFWVPPWLKEAAPALVPLLIHLLRQRIEGELCQPPDGSAPPSDGGMPCEPPPEPEPRRPPDDRESWYSRVWPGRDG